MGSDTGSRQRKKISLRTKLFLIILAVTLICVLFFGLLSNYLVRRQFEQQFASDQQQTQQPVGPPPPPPPDQAHRVNLINLSYLITGLLGIGLAFILSYYLANKISKPLSQLSLATSSIAAGDYGSQVDVKGGREVEELASAFNSLSVTLKDNERLRKNMVADISHELRNPLAAQRGYLEAMEDGVIPMGLSALDVLLKHNALLSRLVEDLRQLSIMDAGQMDLDIAPVRIERLFNAVASSFQHQRIEKQISLKMDIAAGLPEVECDYARITQVMNNLVNNAILYTPQGGRIEFIAGKRDCDVLISVHDSGPGIEEEELGRVFERFHRTDKSRNRDSGGTGLGLSIAKALVEAHQGRMWVDSEVGLGTTISFTLPSDAAAPEIGAVSTYRT
jgi:signal transduction histidine kinase